MKEWFPLSGEEAHDLYAVPSKVALDERNMFYWGRARPDSRDLDGPYLLIALIAHPEKGLCTLYTKSLDAEFQECEDFDPLSESFGDYLDLPKRRGEEFIVILTEYANRLKSAMPPAQDMFRRIPHAELPFQLDAYILKHSEQTVYLQQFDPLYQGEKTELTTYLWVTTSISRPRHKLGFSIKQFDRRQIKKGTRDIDLDNISIARINLDKRGMQELCRLLQRHLSSLD